MEEPGSVYLKSENVLYHFTIVPLDNSISDKKYRAGHVILGRGEQGMSFSELQTTETKNKDQK